ncbi:MAG: hypothetical protein ACKOCU_02210, partial [Betaproteobacteria bacterium]
PLQPASGGLAPVMLALPGQTAVESEPSWLHACSRVKLWAAAVDPDGQDFAVLMHSNAARSAHWSGEPLAWLAHTAEPGVGAVGVSRRDQEGRLRDAGWLVGRDGSCAPIACGMGLDTHGYYGQLCLAHGVSALHGAVLALRLQSIDPDAPGLSLKPGWRMVWTPVAALVADWQADTPSQSAQDRESATLVISAGAARAASSAWDGYSDPSYSPHLCELHRDHRLAIDGVTPQTIKARTR